MALDVAIEWDVRTTGSDNNGGGFKAGATGTDYSQQNSAQYALTGIASAGSGNTILSASAAADMVGNVAQVISGTNFTTGFFEITSVSVGVSITFSTNSASASICTGVGASGVINIGGSVLTIGKVSVPTAAVAGNKIWVKSGTYTLTATTTVTCAGSVASGPIVISGYSATHGDNAARPLITSATNSVALFTLTAAHYTEFWYLNCTHTAGTRGNAFTGATTATTPVRFGSCIIDGCLAVTAVGTNGITSLTMVDCEIKNCTSSTSTISATVNSTFRLFGVDFHDNTGSGISSSGGNLTVTAASCIFDTNSYGIRSTITTGNVTLDIEDCTFVDQTNDGIEIADTSGTMVLAIANNIFSANGGYGADIQAAVAEVAASTVFNRNNAYGNNSVNPRNGLAVGVNDVTLTGDPFTNKTGRDFSLDNTASEGAACRNAGFPSAFLNGTTTSYVDIGAVQHQDTGGGTAGMAFIPNMAGT